MKYHQALTADKERNIKTALTARLIAIYRKQQQDPFNRETILGYPVVAGRYGSIKFCAPLLYSPVDVQYDPVKSIFSTEAEAVISEVKKLIASGGADGLDIGIISPYEAQATLLNKTREHRDSF